MDATRLLSWTLPFAVISIVSFFDDEEDLTDFFDMAERMLLLDRLDANAQAAEEDKKANQSSVWDALKDWGKE